MDQCCLKAGRLGTYWSLNTI